MPTYYFSVNIIKTLVICLHSFVLTPQSMLYTICLEIWLHFLLKVCISPLFFSIVKSPRLENIKEKKLI